MLNVKSFSFHCNTVYQLMPTQKKLVATMAKCLFTNVMLEYIINKIKYKYPAVVPKK